MQESSSTDLFRPDVVTLVYLNPVEYPDAVTKVCTCSDGIKRRILRGASMVTGSKNSRSAAVIFDLDDTLYPERMFVEGGLKAAGDLLDSISHSTARAAGVFRDVLIAEGPFHIFDRSLQILGVDRTPELIAELVRAYRCHTPFTLPFPGTVEMLVALRNAGVGLGVLTDGYVDVQRAKWRALGIERYFDAVVFCCDVDGFCFPKPAPEPFVRAAELLGNPATIIFVGDNPAKDFPAPDALGWKTVRVSRSDTWHGGDEDMSSHAATRPVVTSVEELSTQLFEMIQG